MDGTIKSTARNAGILDINMIPERTNHVKVLIFFDVGGSMDPYIKHCEEHFSALKTEFKHLKYFYFHNCVYESVWEDNRRRTQERFLVQDIINKYSADYKVILDETTTTADLIDRNIMYAKIFIKPARAIEYIVVDFVITKTGADFV